VCCYVLINLFGLVDYPETNHLSNIMTSLSASPSHHHDLSMTSSSNSPLRSCISPNESLYSKENYFKQNDFPKLTSCVNQTFQVNRVYLNIMIGLIEIGFSHIFPKISNNYSKLFIIHN